MLSDKLVNYLPDLRVVGRYDVINPLSPTQSSMHVGLCGAYMVVSYYALALCPLTIGPGKPSAKLPSLLKHHVQYTELDPKGFEQ